MPKTKSYTELKIKNMAQRKFIFNKLKRVFEYLNENKNELTVNEVQSRVEIIKNFYHEFNENINEVCQDMEDFNSNEKDLINFDDVYFKTTDLANNLLKKSRSKESEHEQSRRLHVNYTKPKLPDIPLPVFDGSYDKWYEFENMFNAVIDKSDITPGMKLFYLKKSLQGEARNFLESETITDDNYENAWAQLKSRYANKRFIIENHISDLYNIKSMKTNNSREIRRLIDVSTKHIRI